MYIIFWFSSYTLKSLIPKQMCYKVRKLLKAYCCPAVNQWSQFVTYLFNLSWSFFNLFGLFFNFSKLFSFHLDDYEITQIKMSLYLEMGSSCFISTWGKFTLPLTGSMMLTAGKKLGSFKFFVPSYMESKLYS